MLYRVLNPQMNFDITEHPIRENEKWFDGISLKNGLFSDVGLRFRLNDFDASDSWLPAVPSKMTKFFDVTWFSSDTFLGPSENPVLAQIYFRMEVSQYVHKRVVYGFMDWLGSIAGIEKFLLKWITFIFGGFIQYNAAIEIIN